jgi:hypothetical protein
MNLAQMTNFQPSQHGQDLDAEASAALLAARLMPAGPEKAEALRRAGLLRNAADTQVGIVFARRGRPPLK